MQRQIVLNDSINNKLEALIKYAKNLSLDTKILERILAWKKDDRLPYSSIDSYSLISFYKKYVENNENLSPINKGLLYKDIQMIQTGIKTSNPSIEEESKQIFSNDSINKKLEELIKYAEELGLDTKILERILDWKKDDMLPYSGIDSKLLISFYTNYVQNNKELLSIKKEQLKTMIDQILRIAQEKSIQHALNRSNPSIEEESKQIFSNDSINKKLEELIKYAEELSLDTKILKGILNWKKDDMFVDRDLLTFFYTNYVQNNKELLSINKEQLKTMIDEILRIAQEQSIKNALNKFIEDARKLGLDTNKLKFFCTPDLPSDTLCLRLFKLFIQNHNTLTEQDQKTLLESLDKIITNVEQLQPKTQGYTR